MRYPFHLVATRQIDVPPTEKVAAGDAAREVEMSRKVKALRHPTGGTH